MIYDIHWQNCLSIELKCAKAFSASQVINTRQSYIVESILQCISTCVYLSRHPLSATINILTFISEGLLCFTGMQMMFKKCVRFWQQSTMLQIDLQLHSNSRTHEEGL